MSRMLAGLGLLGAALMGARRGTGERESGRQLFYKTISEDDAMRLYGRLEEEDPQSAQLFIDVVQALQEEMNISSGASAALNRMRAMVMNGQTWDIALLRNNIFKAANSLEMELPSHMF